MNTRIRSNLNHTQTLPAPALLFAAALLLASASGALAALRYVDANSTNATPPYTNWATAATNIQDAVDAAVAGDEIVVTNGLYASGGRAVNGTMTNRVAVDKPLTLRSVNGPQVTVIQGFQVPGTTNGDGGIRCVYLTNGASLSGFSLTNGGGGVRCESTTGVVVSNCVLSGNSAYYGGGADAGTLNNCVLSGNRAAFSGGGAYGCTLNNCELSDNSAPGVLSGGGGAVNCTLNNCTLSGNLAYSGGGADNSTLNNCTLTGNAARHGGGAYGGTLNNCTLMGNSADDGGGASFGRLNNCTLTGNLAGTRGGGAYGGTLNNCTLTGNSAPSDGGGAYYGTLNNCIVYFNTAPQGANYYSSTLNHSCTTPLPPDGAGNISLDPQLASFSHVSAASPCRRAGNAAYASGADIDGEAWSNPPSMGCDEYRAGAVTGALSVVISAYTNTTVGEPIRLTALIEGRTTGSVWEFSDGLVETNHPYTMHEWSAPGDYVVALRAFNESHPAGARASVIVHVLAGVDGVHFVASASSSPVAPYSTWATAATNIQDAVDAAVAGDEIVVANGTYATGGRNGNRVAVDKPLTLRSVNGPQFTLIEGLQVPGSTNGDGAIRCVYLANGSSLSGFTLTNGSTRGYLAWDYPAFRQSSGGGLWCESTNGVVVSNCVITGNSAYYYGGGVYSGTLYNCTLIGNSGGNGGGAVYSTLSNCTVTGNNSGSGGGVYQCTLNNCTITKSGSGSAAAHQSRLSDCTVSGSSRDGVSECTLSNCALTGNSGFGAASSTLNRCTLNGNFGGGAYGCALNNCALTGNYNTGGAYGCFLTNCTLTGNSANADNGGGASYSTLNNCIVYFNNSPQRANYDSSSTLNYCCTMPLPANGVGNISVDPQLANAWRLSAGSPCRGTGSAAYASGMDIDGEVWLNPPSIGCDEYQSGALTGPLSVAITASFTNVTAGYAVQLTALIEGRTGTSIWDFGDGSTSTNQPYTSHAWAATGDYAVVLRGYNESQPGGISATVTVHVVAQPIHYVALASADPVAPYTSWATAATNIQNAVDAATVPGALVLVTNGTYATGGRSVDGYSTNRVVVAKPLAVRSVNGPQSTVINGSQLVRCVWLTNTASLSGFTLTNSGYGAFGGTLNNCVLSRNSYGADHCTLNNCALSGNGYGASFCTLNNCTLTGNTTAGGYNCTLNNCITYFNSSANYDSSSVLNYCCTTPQPANGVGNISVDPQLASAWRLSAASPCGGAGSTNYESGTDIDGEAWRSPPAIGCDEYYPGALTGPLSVGITALFTNVSVGYALQFTALIQGRAASSAWDFGDGITVTNQPYASHAWAALGDYAVVLRAYNESWPGGISATVTVHVVPGIHYVSATSTNAVAPYTSWATAATSIQDAINAAIEPGAQVLVTNGTYAPILVPRLLRVRSVNGPDSTIIYGYNLFGGGDRCAYVASGASLSGFTLTYGFADQGAGVFCESRTAVVTNCILSSNQAGGDDDFGFGPRYERGYGGGAYGGTLNNCTLIDNSVTGYYTGESSRPGGGYGGGAYDCTLNNCVLSGNSAVPNSYSVCDFWCSGGGIPRCCRYSRAYTPAYGGGAYSCTLNNCTLTGNSGAGGGAYLSTLNNCTLARNDSGAAGCTLNNCALTGNGVGASSSSLNNCTLTGNGTGASSSALNNCIAYFNTGANYDSSSTLNYCCTTPQPANGVGNISSDPQLASFSHLSAGSPCRGAGDAAYATGTDIDGEAWLNPPSIGCDEYHAGAVTGPLSVAITASFAPVTMGIAVQFTGSIEGRNTESVWDFGDGITVTNQPYTSHAWTALGDYAVVLRAYNETWPGGINATTMVHVVAGIHYVVANNTNPVAPYTSWATAATNIQDAVDAALEPGAQVLVTNGIYAAGSRVVNGTNRVVLDKGLRVRSVNGPLFTSIDGGQSVRCVYLTSGGSLSGFTLANGHSEYGGGAVGGTLTNCMFTGNVVGYTGYGGGAASCTLVNCTLTGNSANPSVVGFTGYGGGAYQCTLKNCALSGNSAGFGGAVAFSTLTNCTLTGNSANAGGAYGSTLNNCIVYFNTGTNGSNYDASCTLNYSCTTPQPTNGVGNISSDPQLASASHLSFLSPCIGKGNPDAASGVDIDGEPWANRPSMGCDELAVGATTGPLNVSITASFTNVAVGYPVALTGLIEGRADLSIWSFGDGSVEINQPYATHSWSATGDYLVSLWAFNDSYPDGIRATQTVHVVAGVHYVAADSASPVAPYTSWDTAATNIQDAVDAAIEPGAQVLVANGIYTTGGRTVVIAKPLAVRSVNGPHSTAIDGGQANRCVSLANGATLTGFTLTNGAGGAFGGTLNNCTLTGNSAQLYGGGASESTLNNCTLTGNSASYGGGAYSSILNNCTLTGNSASYGGGAYECTLNNCIAYFNTATNGANYYYSGLSYCCTTPQPTYGVGNISSDPQLASFSHLSADSPCRGAGNAAYASGTDIDGEAWLNSPSIGCDEYRAGAATGPMNVGITASFMNVTMGFAVQLTALIEGRTTASVWDFGDGITVTNQPYTSHAWTALGDYAVVLRAFNESQPGGISATVTVHVVNPVHYVAADSAHPVAPYTSWATAAINIQDAVDAATVPGALVLVTNGTYATGGRAVYGTTNRVVIDKLLTMRSVNGSGFTTINGGYSARCVYLTNGANLSGFTLTNGFSGDGGGVFCESVSVVVSNCVLAGNSAVFGGGGGASGGTLNNCTLSGNSAYESGGAYECTLNNCALTGNSAYYGGGASHCILNNCTVTDNSARYSGGGVYHHCTLNNCILYFNTAGEGANYYYPCTLNYCCTMPAGGFGNITNAPLFVDRTSGNLRLDFNSPCINAGNNSYVTNATDLEGRPRIVGGTVDIGAFEFQGPGSVSFYAWLQQYGLPADGSADYTDPDGDGMNNWREWLAGTVPTDGTSALRLLTPIFTPPGVVLRWSSDTNHAYSIERTTSPNSPAAFTLVRTNVPGLSPTTTCIDTNAPLQAAAFYRIGTDSINASSPLWLETPVLVPASTVVIWTSVANRSYFLERATNVATPMLFTPLATNIPGQPATTAYADTNAIGSGPFFYRVGVAGP